MLAASAAVASDGPPAAHVSAGSPIVGALFGAGSTAHSCTGTVIQSLSEDLLLTAAHCVSDTGAGMTFVPNWRDGSAPEGTWTVVAAYALPGWIKSGDPHEDMAILRVAPQTIDGRLRTLQSVTGAAWIDGTPAVGTTITDVAYNNGDDEPISCTVPTYLDDEYPAFDCGGFVAGSSGSPWLVNSDGIQWVTGVIGGLSQGGCVDYTSYSSPFDNKIRGLWMHAEFSLQGDTLPEAVPNDC